MVDNKRNYVPLICPQEWPTVRDYSNSRQPKISSQSRDRPDDRQEAQRIKPVKFLAQAGIIHEKIA